MNFPVLTFLYFKQNFGTLFFPQKNFNKQFYPLFHSLQKHKFS